MRRPCRDCGLRPAVRFFCVECGPRRLRESNRRSKTNYRRSPRGKIMAALWNDRNRDHILSLARARYPRRSGVVAKCRAIGCVSTWVRTEHNGAKKWCWSCASDFYGRVYAMKRRRPRRAVGKAA